MVPSSCCDGVETRRQVGDDQRVGAGIDLHVAARREHRAPDERRRLIRLRVAERVGAHRERAGVGRRLRQLGPRVLLAAQRLDPGDADDGAVDGVVELIAAQDHLERLIPRHVGEHDVDRALDVGIDDHVEAADLGEGAQHRAQIDALEIHADRMAGVLLLLAAGDLVLVRLQDWRRGGRRGRSRGRRLRSGGRRGRRLRWHTACGRWRGRGSSRERARGLQRGHRVAAASSRRSAEPAARR